jgi:hypothetical protein
MRRLFWLLVSLLALAATAQAAKFIAKGSTSQSISVVIYDDNGDPNTAGVTIANLDLYCLRDGHAMSAKTDLAAATSDHAAWSSGKAFHQGLGLYRIDIPDANLSNPLGTMLTYTIVDTVSHNRTAYYEVQLNPPVDVNTICLAAPPSSAELVADLKIGEPNNVDIATDIADLYDSFAAAVSAKSIWQYNILADANCISGTGGGLLMMKPRK